MSTSRRVLAIATATLLLLAAGFGDNPQKRRLDKGGQKGGAGVEPAVVPDYLFNVILSRPGADSITASLLAWKDMEAVISYGESAEKMTGRTPSVSLVAGVPQHLAISHLKPDTQYFYTVTTRIPGQAPAEGEKHRFHTRRSPSSSFRFAVQADSHLDTSSDVRVYQQTLDNILADAPDFMIDLGDTTMVDKFGSFYTRAETQYKAQRYYFGLVAHSVPLFMVLGNHDGEQGARLTERPDCMPLWSVGMRKKYFANPEPGGIYTGNAAPEKARACWRTTMPGNGEAPCSWCWTLFGSPASAEARTTGE